MFKKFNIFMLITLLITMFTIPVYAQETTDPTKVIMEDTFVSNEDALAQEFHNSEIWRCENYIKYLDGVIYNLNETARIKNEIVNNYIWLSQYNPAYASYIPTAEKDLIDAQLWVNAYKLYKPMVRNDLKIRYNY